MDAGEKFWGLIRPPKFDISDIMEIKDVEQLKKVNKASGALAFWRWKVSVFLLIGFLFVGWAFSPWGFVMAGDVEQKVQKAIEPIKTELSGVNKKLEAVDNIQGVLNELLSQKVATDICRVVKRRKAEKDPNEAQALRTEIDGLQVRYKTLTKENYPEERCQ